MQSQAQNFKNNNKINSLHYSRHQNIKQKKISKAPLRRLMAEEDKQNLLKDWTQQDSPLYQNVGKEHSFFF